MVNYRHPCSIIVIVVVALVGWMIWYQVHCYNNERKFDRIYDFVKVGQPVEEVIGRLEDEGIPYDHSSTDSLSYQLDIGIENSLNMDVELDEGGDVVGKEAKDTGLSIGLFF